MEIQKLVDKYCSWNKNLFFIHENNGDDSNISLQSTLWYILYLYQNPVKEIVINV